MLANNKNNVKRILLTGGGTGGSAAPLLAVAGELKNPPYPLASSSTRRSGPLIKGAESVNPYDLLYQGGENKIPLTPCLVRLGSARQAARAKRAFAKGGSNEFEFLWLGTKFGPERAMVEQAGIKFKAISGGKLRRYFSFKNLADIFKIKLGFWQAFFIMLKWRPDLVISAGSFISVPVVWAAWLLRVPVLIHQQDVKPGLANKLMAPFARLVTVSFEKSLADYGKKARWIGNPVRELRITNYELRIKMPKDLPIVLVLGGGMGARAINKLVEESLDELIKFCKVIHITGRNKGVLNKELGIMNYGKYEFLEVEQMAEALNLADLVITRAGLATLSELSSLGKPSIIIPMPESHQEANAEFFKELEAAVVVKQKDLTPENFVSLIKILLADESRLKKLSANMGRAMKNGSGREMAKIVLGIINNAAR